MHGCYHLVPDRNDYVFPNDEINLLLDEAVMLGESFRYMEHKENVAVICRDDRERGGGEELGFNAGGYAEFFCNGADIFRRGLFDVYPPYVSIFIPIYHTGKYTRGVYSLCVERLHVLYSICMHHDDIDKQDENAERSAGQRVAIRSALFALIVGGAFFSGFAIGNAKVMPVSIAARIPIVGDGLDATPDPSIDLSDFWKAWNALGANYVLTHASSSLPTGEEKIWGAIEGLAASYGDPYTVFFPPQESKEFMENISGSFAGVGMEIDVKDGVLTVIAPLKGTPAESAGIRPGDLVIEIDGATTEGLSTEQAVKKIRGPAGTEVVLTIVRNGKKETIPITRAVIQVPQTEDGFIEGTNVYRIALYEFTANSGQSFSRALKRFATSGSRSLIIDLRGNPGGYLEASVDIASYFLPKGEKVVTEDFGGSEEARVYTSRGYRGLSSGTEVVVLVDGGSASASEILAGALQDAKKATVIGTRSFGKGSVQQLISIGDGSLKVTVARWITPKGRSLMENGIVPDIAVERTEEDARAKKDPQLDRAVQFLVEGK